MTNAQMAEYLNKINEFVTGDSKQCPMCDEPVWAARCYEKLDPGLFSLYVLPCKHRLGLWSKVPAWIEDVEIVPTDDIVRKFRAMEKWYS